MIKIKRTERKELKCLKEITKTLKIAFAGIQANSYGYCCNTDYDDRHSYINNNNYVVCKLYKGGINNNYHNGKWDNIGDEVYYGWHLTNFNLDDIIEVMQNIANKYGYKVVKPQDNLHCIKLLLN